MPTTRVSYCSPTNSTLFCRCGNAVLDSESHCSKCKCEVWPKEPSARHQVALREQMGPERYAEHRRYVEDEKRKDKLGTIR